VRWKAPSFWWAPCPSVLAKVLCPLSWTYSLVQKRITTTGAQGKRAPVPVISVGNVVVGGAGKTPFTLALAELLTARGLRPVVVTRGYGGGWAGPVWVDPGRHTVQDVGDEALALARKVSTVLSRRRCDALDLVCPDTSLITPGTVIVLDDGHHHSSLVKDVSLVVVDGVQRWGNGLPMPAGPLREPLHTGLKRAQGIVWVGDGDIPQALLGYGKIFKVRAVLESPFPEGTPVVGFAGIGYPPKFRASLVTAGLEVKDFVPFPDHYVYTQGDIDSLIKLARNHQAVLVTTEKDSLRLPQGTALTSGLTKLIGVMTLTFEIEDPERLVDFLLETCDAPAAPIPST